jgi:PAS domain S-box-containing protein
MLRPENLDHSEISPNDNKSLDSPATRRGSPRRAGSEPNQAAVGITMASLEGRLVEVNEKTCAILGYSGEELQKLTLFDVTHADDREATRISIDRLLAGEIDDFVQEKRYVRKDGSVVWSTTTVTLLKDAAGKPQRLIGVIEDVSLRRSAEAALRESEERFRAIVQATPECVKVVAPDGTLLAMNSAGCGMIEAASDHEVVGRSVYPLITPEFRESFTAFNESICRGNKGHLEFEIVGIKGTRLRVETHAVPMRDPATGQMVQLAVTRDVTGARAADEKLRRSEEELRALADSIPQLAWMADPSGEIFWYNLGWYEYTGSTFEEMQGSGWKAMHDPRMLPQVLARWEESIRTESPFEMEFPLRGADGVFRWFLTRVSPFRDQAGRLTRWFGTNTNIDEQRQLMQSVSDARDNLEKRVQERTAELATANENLRDLSARLLQVQDDERRRLARELHDSVGQLLAAVGMNVGIVQSQSSKLDARGARAVSENAQLVEQVSREIRTISHLLHPPLLEIAGLASALRWYVDGFSERSGIKVDMDLPADFERLPNDTELAIFRIVQECLTNIHRHSGSATASISIRPENDRLLLQVRDYGKGIPREKLQELSRINRSRIGFGGMRERVHQLGGTLDVRSEDTGTTVSATLKVR